MSAATVITTVQGSSGTYEIRLGGDGNVYCTCPAWKFQKLPPKERTCKHMKALSSQIAAFTGKLAKKAPAAPVAAPKAATPVVAPPPAPAPVVEAPKAVVTAPPAPVAVNPKLALAQAKVAAAKAALALAQAEVELAEVLAA